MRDALLAMTTDDVWRVAAVHSLPLTVEEEPIVMLRPLRSLLLSLLFALSVSVSAQITLPVDRFVESAALAVETRDALGQPLSARGRDGVMVVFETRAGALAQVAGAGLFDAPTVAEVARLLAVATGYFDAIEAPIANYLSQNLGQLADLGPFSVAVESYRMTLEVRGSAAPFEVVWSVALAEVPESSFLPARHSIGAADARYVIREFSDLQCPFCARYAAQVLPALKATLLERDDVRFEYHHFALGGGLVHGALAAEASECVVDANADDAEAFWQYTDALFERQSVWSSMADPAAYFVRVAADIGLRSEGVAGCLAAGSQRAAVVAAGERATLLGIGGTPTVFVGPYRLRDFSSIEGYLQAMAWIDAFTQE